MINEVLINSNEFIGQGREMITIVPEKTELEGEVLISNFDIGFVLEGQRVEIKLDTFPFQDYGSLEGELKIIGSDAIEVNGELFYKGYIKIVGNNLRLEDKYKKIIAGMTFQGEIQTEKRRVIDFFLSPFKKSLEESFKLR